MRFQSRLRKQSIGQTVAVTFLCIAVVLSFGALSAVAQQAPPPPSYDISVNTDSGQHNSENAGSVWSKTLTVKDAKWLQLHFSDLVLSAGKLEGSKLKITSLADGAVQLLDCESCAQWQSKSAFFNGNSVKVEIIAHEGAQGNRVVIDRITVGQSPGPPQQSICGAVDNRQLSNDVRVGRTNNGCTAWLFEDRPNCLITAGHCTTGMNTVFFNVPISNANGSLNFPPPKDQYAVDPASVQFENGGVGDDWCYFGCFDNSTTGLSPFEAQGDSFDLATPNSSTFNTSDSIRITGFGVTSSPVSPTFNQAQKTHAGPFVSFSGTELSYETDTTGGNSGSPVIDASTGTAYGVHTHGGCNSFGGNFGTGYNNSDFLAAIANPQGICAAPIVPANDDCAEALYIRDGTFNFDTTHATTDGPALPADCDEGRGLSFENDIWYQYRATFTGHATFSFCISQYDTRVAAYEDDGNCTGDLLACNDDFCGSGSRMTFEVVKGADYLIRVGGFSGGGLGIMHVSCVDSGCPVELIVLNNELNINATQGPDDILVVESDGALIIRVNTDDCVVTLPVGKIQHININGFGGADTIRVVAPFTTTINGGPGDDELRGGPLENNIVGGGDADSIFGGGKADLIFGGPGGDFIYALDGNDMVFGGGEDDLLRGGLGHDELIGGPGADSIYGSIGNDTLNGDSGDDYLSGGSGVDTLKGHGGSDTMFGGPGNDDLEGDAGNDIINGGSGSDTLKGHGGADTMFGGPGHDTFVGGDGVDTMNGGSGNDTSLDDGEVEVSIEN